MARARTQDLRTRKEIGPPAPGQSRAVERDPDVKLSEELRDAYHNASRRKWVGEIVENRLFVAGAQWTEDEKNELKARDQYPVVIPVLRQALEQAKAFLTYNKPRWFVVGAESSDVRLAKMWSDILAHIWNASDGNVQHKQVVEDYYCASMGVYYAYFDSRKDYNKGEICIRSVDPTLIYIDPNSQDPFSRDAANILIVTETTGEQLQERYPDIVDILKVAQPSRGTDTPVSNLDTPQGQIKQNVDVYHTRYERINRFTKILLVHYGTKDSTTGEERNLTGPEFVEFQKRPAWRLMTGGGEVWVTNEAAVQRETNLIAQLGLVYHFEMNQETGQPEPAPGPELEGSIPNSTVEATPATIADAIRAGVISVRRHEDTKVLHVFSVGGVLVYKNILPLSEYPVITIPNHFYRNPYPGSDIQMVKPLQRYINKIRSLIIAHASNSTNLKLLIPRGSVKKADVENEWKKAGAAVIEYDAELGKPEVAGAMPLPNELYKNEADAHRDIEEALGLYSLGAGSPNNAPETYRATMALDEFGQRRIKGKVEDLEAGLNQLAKVVIQLVQAYWTFEKVIRIIEPNNPPRTLVVNQQIYDSAGQLVETINDVSRGHYDVVCVSGSMLPTNRWARFDYYMNLYERGVIDQVEVLKQTEVVDVEGVLNRSSHIAKLQSDLEAAIAQIKALQGDLQTAQRESTHDRKRVELEKFKTALAEIEARLEASAKSADQKTRNDIEAFRGKVALQLKALELENREAQLAREEASQTQT